MTTAGIYKITCVSNQHFYIGRTSNYTKRIGQHKIDLKSGKHKNQRMQHCFDKYGADSFVYELLMVADESTDLIAEEQRLIDECINQPNCMNINRSAKVFCDVPFTEERRRKISESRKGQVGQRRSAEQRKHISDSLKGHILSEETKRKISESHKGKKLKPEVIEKLKTRFAGKGNPMYGRTGSNHPHSKPVWQVDPITGEKIQRFESAVEAAKAFGARDGSNLRKAIKRKIRAYGFYWLECEEGQSTIESKGNLERVE